MQCNHVQIDRYDRWIYVCLDKCSVNTVRFHWKIVCFEVFAKQSSLVIQIRASTENCISKCLLIAISISNHHFGLYTFFKHSLIHTHTHIHSPLLAKWFYLRWNFNWNPNLHLDRVHTAFNRWTIQNVTLIIIQKKNGNLITYTQINFLFTKVEKKKTNTTRFTRWEKC